MPNGLFTFVRPSRVFVLLLGSGLFFYFGEKVAKRIWPKPELSVIFQWRVTPLTPKAICQPTNIFLNTVLVDSAGCKIEKKITYSYE